MNWMAVYIVCSIYEWFLFDGREKLLYFLKEVWIISLTKKVVCAEINRRDINANMNKLFTYIFAKSVDDARNWRWPEIWIMIEMIMNVFSCWCPYTVAACYVEMIYVTYNPTLRIYHCSHRYNMMTSSWNHFPRCWPFVQGINRSPVNSPHKGQWRGVLMFSLMCAWTNDWVNNRDAGDLRRHRAHYDVIVM